MHFWTNWVIEEIGKEIKAFLESNENKIYQNHLDRANAVLRVKFISISTYVKKQRSQINNLMMYLKVLEKRISQTQS
jgi:hypothetical protein